MFTIMWYNMIYLVKENKKMRKIALILACIMLVLPLVACSEKDPAETPATNTNIETYPAMTIAGEFEVPYRYDLSSFIDITKEDYFGIKLDKLADATVTDEDVNNAIAADLSNFKEIIPITDRGAENGDTINFDFKGYESGVAFDRGEAKGHEMVLGQGNFIDGFEEQLVGHKAGEEFTIDVTFPENYEGPLAGKLAQFEIKMNSVSTIIEPQLTVEFVQEHFFCDTIEDYLLQKKNELEETKRLQAENEQKTKAFDAIYAAIKVNKLPQDRYEKYATQTQDNVQNTAAMYGMTLEQLLEANGMTTEDYNEYIDNQATAYVEQEIIAYYIANAEGLLEILTKEGYTSYLDGLAASYGTDAETFAASYPSDMIWNSYVLETVINFVVDNAVIE